MPGKRTVQREPVMAESEKSFEQGMADLEQIVRQLESGELSLEQALAAFESGIGLVRGLNQRLADAEARVEVLTRDAQGSLQLQPLDRTRPPKG